MALLVRTWNLFHGNAHPPERASFLEEMVRLASADGPHVLCLQEVPPWAISRLSAWSGMTAHPVVARRPSIGPFPSTAELGRRLTAIHAGRLRSAFAGQANAILLAPGLRAVAARSIVLNPHRFRSAQARWLGLHPLVALTWAKERRVCQALRVRLADGRDAVVANLHATPSRDRRISDAEVLRAATFADALARPQDLCVLAGDFNARPERSRSLADLSGPDWGFSEPVAGIDHVLVRGAPAAAAERWPIERRRVGARVLSDHAPVEVEIQ